MEIILNVNIDALVVYTNKLEKMSRSALPIAVRTSLNSVAFDVKQKSMPRSVKRFTERQPNFFKANSRVEMAKGFNVNEMHSLVGFTSENLRLGATNYAVNDLEQQEYGGQIDKKTFIPLDEARSGNSQNKLVRPSNRLTVINGLINSNKVGATSPRAAFIRAAFKSGPGGYVIGNTGNEILWRIDSINKNSRGLSIKKTGLYSFSQGRSVHVRETGFMRFASIESGYKIEKFFIEEAEKQFAKLAK